MKREGELQLVSFLLVLWAIMTVLSLTCYGWLLSYGLAARDSAQRSSVAAGLVEKMIFQC